MEISRLPGEGRVGPPRRDAYGVLGHVVHVLVLARGAGPGRHDIELTRGSLEPAVAHGAVVVVVRHVHRLALAQALWVRVHDAHGRRDNAQMLRHGQTADARAWFLLVRQRNLHAVDTDAVDQERR